MLIPRDQFNDKKDYYIFGIYEAPQSKRLPKIRKKARFLITLPHSPDQEVNSILQMARARKFTKLRIENGETFSLKLSRLPRSTLESRPITVTIGYSDVKGNAKKKKNYYGYERED